MTTRRAPDDTDPYAVSHLGWGLNPQARWYGIGLNGDAPERSRAAARTFPGNFLFSTGPNTQGGGKRATRGHYDVPMRDCTVILDNEVVIDQGRIVDPKQIVQRVRAVIALQSAARSSSRHENRKQLRRSRAT